MKIWLRLVVGLAALAALPKLPFAAARVLTLQPLPEHRGQFPHPAEVA